MLSKILKFMLIVILFIPFTFCSVLILGPVIEGYNEGRDAYEEAADQVDDGEQLLEEF